MQIPTLPFNAFGTMALARSEFETNSGSSQVFWLLKVRFLTLELLYNAMQAMVALQCKQCAKGKISGFQTCTYLVSCCSNRTSCA